MKLVRYTTDATTRIGAQLPDGAVVPTPWECFDDLLREADPAAAVRAWDVAAAVPVASPRLLAPTVARPQLIGTGGNYPDHAAEAAAEIQTRDPVFFPFLWGALIGPSDDIVVPTPDTLTDYEVEFAVVIGRTARGLAVEDAMDHVFGYTVVNDVSAREVMARDRMQVLLCKSPDTFLPLGPCVVTRDEIPDPHALGIASYVNGEVRQKSTTGAMAWRIPELLARLTRTVTLHPGDVVTTGTPGGVGYFRDPPEFLRPGDQVTVEVERVGRLTNAVRAGW